MIAWAPLLAADLVPYLKLIGLVIFFSIMAINKMLAGLKKSQGPLPPPSNASSPQNPDAFASTRQELNAEVKEFLKRASQQRSGQRVPQAPAARPPAPVSPGAARRSEGQRKQKRKSHEPKPAVQPASKADDSLANRHMTSRLETSTLDDRADQLSSLDRQNEIDTHVLQALDHQVGQLTTGSSSSSASPSAAGMTAGMAAGTTAGTTAGVAESQANSAADIAALLRDPRTIRTAMILNEILARPVDRW